jgi:hypothetical protein
MAQVTRYGQSRVMCPHLQERIPMTTETANQPAEETMNRGTCRVTGRSGPCCRCGRDAERLHTTDDPHMWLCESCCRCGEVN